MAFADHFSRQARDYTQFRPRYPRELFEFIASLMNRRELAWDCGTGNGQAAVDLAAYFQRVVATDPSANQVAHAIRHLKVQYMVAAAESCPLEPDSADAITVAQALHWFDLPRFYAQVRRVGRAGSVIAAWSYGLAHITPTVDHVIGHLYADILGDYWPPQRHYIEKGYRTIDFPFDDVPAPQFAMQAEWTLDELFGYLGTWSSVDRFRRQNASDPLAQVEADLRAAWGPADQARRVHWPLYLRVGRVNH
jgi:hypothetical protein